MERLGQRISLFAKSTRVENMGPGILMFRVTQGDGNSEKQIFASTIPPHRHMYVFGSDIYRNDSTENPIHVYVRLGEEAQQWTFLHRSVFRNATIRVAGDENAEPPIVIEKFKGSKVGRLRVVVEMKLGIKKIMNKIGLAAD